MSLLQVALPSRTLRSEALAALECENIDKKVLLAGALYAQSASLSIANASWHEELIASKKLPGQPEKPALMQHLDVPQRSIFTPQGLAALVHSVCHIEFNAINLALDAVWRFPCMPAQYYVD